MANETPFQLNTVIVITPHGLSAIV